MIKKSLFTLILVLLIGFACTEQYDNPLDPEADATVVTPDPPTGLTTQVFSDSLIRLQWSAGLNYGFSIRRNSLIIGTLTPSTDQVKGGTFTYDDTSRYALNTELIYEVRTLLPNGTEAGSSVTRTVNFGAPANLAAVFTSDSLATLTWQDNTTNELGFDIQRKVGSGSFSTISTQAPNTAVFSDNGPFTVGTVYEYRVRVFASRNELFSNTATGSVQLPAPDQISAAIASSNAIRVTWRDNSAIETGFLIYRKRGTGAFEQVGIAPRNATQFLDVFNYEVDEALQYRVVARTRHNQTPSDISIIQARFPAPTGVMATFNEVSKQTTISWTDNVDIENGYEISRKLNAGTFVPLDTLPANTITFTDAAALEEASDVVYRVRAVAFPLTSNYAESNTISTPPAAPVNAKLEVVDPLTIKLTWENASARAESFEIQRNQNGNVNVFIDAGTAQQADRTKDISYTFGNDGETVFARVRAVRGSMKSEYATVSYKLNLPVTTLVSAVEGTPGMLRITWRNAAGPITGFRLHQQLATGGVSTLVTAKGDTSIQVTAFENSTVWVRTVFGGLLGGESLRKVLILYPESLNVVQTYNSTVGAYSSASITKSGQHIVLGGATGYEVRALPTPAQVIKSGTMPAAVTAVKASPEHNLVAIGDALGGVRLIDDGDYLEVLPRFQAHNKPVTSFALPFESDSWFVSGSKDSTAVFWNVSNGSMRFRIPRNATGGQVTALQLTQVGSDNYLVASGSSPVFLRYFTASNTYSHSGGQTPAARSLTGMNIGSDQVLMIGAHDGRFVPRIPTGLGTGGNTGIMQYTTLVPTPTKQHNFPVVGTAWLGDKTVATADTTGRINVWNFGTPGSPTTISPFLQQNQTGGTAAIQSTSWNNAFYLYAAGYNGTLVHYVLTKRWIMRDVTAKRMLR
jgi:WD40 repeat protein